MEARSEQTLLGVTVFFVLMVLGGAWVLWGGWPFSKIPELFSTDTPLENRALRGGNFLMLVFLGFWFLMSAVVGAIVADPRFGSTSEKLVVFAGLVSLTTMSGINWAHEDALMNWRAQALLDAFLVVFAVAILLPLSRWKPKRDLSAGVRFFAIYFCAAFGIILPLIYLSVALLIVFGVDELKDEKFDAYIKIASFILGFPATALALANGKDRGADKG